MRRHQGTSFRVVLCMAITALFLAFLVSRPALGGEAGTRPIASMTADERQHLPDNTMVKLKSGRTASLGTLRAEHQARMERFSKAAALGQMTAAKLATRPASSRQLSPAPTASVQSATGPATKNGANSHVLAPSPSLSRAGSVALLNPGLVPFQMPKYKSITATTIPKDYSDFCGAANASACVYLPASTAITSFGDPTNVTSWAYDEDWLITAPGVCTYDGGEQFHGGCIFYYPINYVAVFKPTGPLSTAAACDPPAKYYVDPKGAIRAYYDSSSLTFTTGGTPITCVVQVTISK
jgi:hypothetical protein